MKIPAVTLILPYLIVVIQETTSIRCSDINVRYGRVKYRSRGRVAIFGCWAGFTIYGEKYAGCFRGSWDVTPPKCVRKGCSEVSFKFGTIRKPFFNTAVLAFRCFAGYNLVGPKELFCDGSTYSSAPPYCKREETDISCDFENQQLCKWRYDVSANLTMQIRQMATPSRVLNTGPDHDHTLDPLLDGYYLYLESSSTVPGETARIYSPYLPHANDDNTCFKFWYHMFGSTIGALNVYINDTKVFERGGNRGDRWRLGKVKLPTTSHFKIVIEAITGRGYNGDIALDDLDMGPCTDQSGSTCLDRCSEDESDEFTTCDCHPGCADDQSCCNDFKQYCIAETTTEVTESSMASSESTTDMDSWMITAGDNIETMFETNSLSTLPDVEVNIQTDYTTLSLDDYHDSETVTTYNFDLTSHYTFTDGLEASDPSETSTDVNMENDITLFLSFISTNRPPSNDSEIVLTSPKNPIFKELNSTCNTQHTSTSRYNLRPRTTVVTESTAVTQTPSKKSDHTTNTAKYSFPSVLPTTKLTSHVISPTTTKSTFPTISPTTTQSMLPTISSTTTKSMFPTISPTTTKSTFQTISPTTTKSFPIVSPTAANPTFPTVRTTIKHSTTRKSIPIEHRPVTGPTRNIISTKDPKITTHNLQTTSKMTTLLNSVSTVRIPVVQKLNNSNEVAALLPTNFMTQTEPKTDTASEPTVKTKWKSKYKPKGAFQLVVEEEKKENVSWAGVFVVLACIVLVFVSVLAVIIFLRKRRLITESNDGAEILFIPADEMLDFTPASGGQNRDSGVYSETVVTLKRNKC